MSKLFISVVGVVGVILALATKELPVVKVTLHVTSEDGSDLSNVNGQVTFMNPVDRPGVWGSSDNFSRSGKTDANGLFVVEERAGFEIHYGASSAEYYRTLGRFDFKTTKDGRYQPWNPTLDIVLKRIVNPIPMYARRIQIDMPVSDQSAGFDLVACDWVAPYGKGKVSDFIFGLKRRFASRRDYESAVTIAFSNPGDGLRVVEAPTEYGSELKLPRTAPDAGYTPEVTTSIAATSGAPHHEDARANRNYLFRVRTILDQNKKPVSALYGKIDGDIRLDPINSKTCILLFTYYLNPTPNDRNMEFDPKRNLFTDLKSEERVTAP